MIQIMTLTKALARTSWFQCKQWLQAVSNYFETNFFFLV